MGRSSKTAAIEEPDELELVDDDEADEELEEAPKKKGKKAGKPKAEPIAKAPKTASTGYGAAWLAEYVNDQLDTEYTAANIRVLLRKMAADGEIEREVGTDRARYEFTGENDRIVKAVLKRVRSGEVDNNKADRLAAAKNGSKKTKAADDEDTPAKPVKKAKKAAPVEEDEAPPRTKATRRRKAE